MSRYFAESTSPGSSAFAYSSIFPSAISKRERIPDEASASRLGRSACTPAGRACVMCSSIPEGATAVRVISVGLPTAAVTAAGSESSRPDLTGDFSHGT